MSPVIVSACSGLAYSGCSHDLAELREQRVLYGPLVGGLRDAEIDHLRNRRAVLSATSTFDGFRSR